MYIRSSILKKIVCSTVDMFCTSHLCKIVKNGVFILVVHYSCSSFCSQKYTLFKAGPYFIYGKLLRKIYE
jgi:hypothetical protein